MPKVKYQIKQIKDARACDYAFDGWNYAKDKYNPEDYDVVYEGEIEVKDADVYGPLEKLFQIFNINHPADFEGHSLSTSDVVHLGDTDYYCDSIGWVALK